MNALLQRNPAHRPKRAPRERTADMAKAYRRGMTLRQIANAWGITHQRVHQILEVAGVTMRPAGPSPK